MRTSSNFNFHSYLRSRSSVAIFLGLALALIVGIEMPAAAQTVSSQIVITPSSTVPLLAGTTRPISNIYGNQTNPRVDCNSVSYTFDDLEGTSTIHYFDLATGTDNIAPGNTLDRLSDIRGNRLAFTELDGTGDHIVLFDMISHTRTVVPGDHRTFPRMGGNILTFWQFYYLSAPANDEVGIYDLITGAVTLLTNDSLPDQFPAVSPTGNAVVWQKCLPDGLSCDIYSAIQTSPGVFTTQGLTDASGDERQPQTDGQIVVYTSDKSGENDIYFQPVGGGTETRIAIPGDQREPTISENLISFESNQMGFYEIYVYDLSSGTLYQTTNTSMIGYDKTLNHISVCNGTGQVVYSVPGAGAFDVYAFTFQPPDPPNGHISDLISLVRGFGLPKGIETSLVVKLQDAIAALNAGDTATACSALGDFINEVNAQSGKKLTVQQAEQLVDSATAIRALIGCG